MKRLVFPLILIFSAIIFSACNPFAKKIKSGLQVQITNNIDASVYLNGNYVEKTPFVSRELNPGEYNLTIQPDDPNLIPYETSISLKPGLLTVITWKLAERPEFSGGVIYEMEKINSKNESEISFVTIPDGAIVSVAGKDKTFSPVIVPNINPGHVEFEVSLPSYGVQQHTINAIPGYRMVITVKLAKENLVQQNNQETKEETIPKKDDSQIEDLTILNNNNSSSDSAKVLLASEKQVEIKSTNFFVDGKESLRVRDLPNPSGKELGFANVGETYLYLNKVENNWINIEFNGESGWVSGEYAELVE